MRSRSLLATAAATAALTLVPLAAPDIRELTDALSPFTEADLHVAS